MAVGWQIGDFRLAIGDFRFDADLQSPICNHRSVCQVLSSIWSYSDPH